MVFVSRDSKRGIFKVFFKAKTIHSVFKRPVIHFMSKKQLLEHLKILEKNNVADGILFTK